MSFLSKLRRTLGRPSAVRRPAVRTSLGLTCLEGRSLPSATVMSSLRHGGAEHPAEVRQERQVEVNDQHGGVGQVGDTRREDRRADRAAEVNDVRREDRQADRRADRGTEVNDVRREDRRADRTGTPGADDPAGHDAGHPEARHGGTEHGANHT
jgi:hypothetical protein